MLYENNQNNSPETISDRIKKLRKDKGWSQAKLAEMLYVDRKSISSYENGKTEMHVDLLCRYVEIFGVSADYILFGNNSIVINKDQLPDCMGKNSNATAIGQKPCCLSYILGCKK